MVTTIQVSEKLKKRLAKHKTTPRETYEDVIAKALDVMDEDALEVSAPMKAEVARARRQVKSGKTRTTEELLKELGF